MATESRGGPRKIWVTLALMVLVAILLISTYRASQSVLITVLAGVWCLLFIIVPSILLNRLFGREVLKPPGKRVMVLSYAVLTVYTLALAGFEISTGAAPGSWGITFVAAGGFLGAVLAARREFS